jgi:hypothetical protein
MCVFKDLFQPLSELFDRLCRLRGVVFFVLAKTTRREQTEKEYASEGSYMAGSKKRAALL